ncbi:hypothetical protein N7478_006753 [Penicillium angulare]|uniref:uncharacterized protein n=1 Tax=Penicillium angulare TaxID=116970 RepID=UPI00253F9A80|nr:uncharacterized protein N7478_006753 [Penicillium angulare]KAJ5281381.1 hypothetical protein N7478_006753 [Penicillium angulare]
MMSIHQSLSDLIIQAYANSQEITKNMEGDEEYEWLWPQNPSTFQVTTKNMEDDKEDESLCPQHPSTLQETTKNMEDDKEGEELQNPSTAQESPLIRLPNEILQEIAIILQHDIDVVRLGLSCKEAYERILSPNAPIWKIRYKQKYDLTRNRDSDALFVEYITRSIVLRHKLDIEKNNLFQIQTWIEEIETMLSEVLYTSLPVGAVSKTYEQIRKAVKSVNFLSRPLNDHPSENFYAVHLCLTALALDPEVCTSCYRDDYNIQIVYSVPEPISGKPFIDHDIPYLAILLDFRNFWQRHLLNSTEGTFYESFSRLSKDLKPKARKTDGSHPMDLSKSWIGYYSCIHPTPSDIAELARRQSCADLDSHWDQVEIMTLEIETRSREPFWPDECNSVIPLANFHGWRRLFFKGHQNILGATSDAANPIFGFIEPIELAFGGIVGWIRICFAICERVDKGEDPAWTRSSSGWVHGYEAMIIPGGRIMLGRWVDMKDESGRGPFIFWDV